MERDFKGIWIPKDIRLSKDLSIQEKVLLVEIQSLDKDDGCFASNKYFAEFFGLSPKYVSRLINGLNDKGKISIMITPNNGNRRTLHILEGGIPQKMDTYPTKSGEGILQKEDSSNTYNNTTIKEKSKNSIYESKQFGLAEQVSIAFLDFLQNRPTKTYSDRAINGLLNILKPYSDDIKLKMIESSVNNNYQGLFPIKGIKPQLDYLILENFDKGCRTNIDEVKNFFKNKYGQSWQEEYSKKRKERLRSPFITKGN